MEPGLGKDKNGNIVQAMPINRNTFIGAATNQACANKTTHVHTDCTILTFHYPTGDKVLGEQLSGMDYHPDKECTGVTSDGVLVIS